VLSRAAHHWRCRPPRSTWPFRTVHQGRDRPHAMLLPRAAPVPWTASMGSLLPKAPGRPRTRASVNKYRCAARVRLGWRPRSLAALLLDAPSAAFLAGRSHRAEGVRAELPTPLARRAPAPSDRRYTLRPRLIPVFLSQQRFRLLRPCAGPKGQRAPPLFPRFFFSARPLLVNRGPHPRVPGS